jgi:hypothetical protein
MLANFESETGTICRAIVGVGYGMSEGIFATDDVSAEFSHFDHTTDVTSLQAFCGALSPTKRRIYSKANG